MAVVAPMPSPSVRVATSANPGWRIRLRSARRRSDMLRFYSLALRDAGRFPEHSHQPELTSERGAVIEQPIRLRFAARHFVHLEEPDGHLLARGFLDAHRRHG